VHILVIGGTRFIGPIVVTRLHDAGHAVTLFHRGRSRADGLPDIPHIYGDRGRLFDFRDTFARIAPDIVLDMAPATEADALAVRTTFMGIAHRSVAISSSDVYRAFGVVNRTESDAPDPAPITEDAPLRRNLYPHRDDDAPPLGDARRWKQEYDKILVERVVMGTENLPGTILRLPFVYGPRDYLHRLWPYLSLMVGGQPTITLDARRAAWRATHGYVENVAAAIVLAITDDRARARVYNVAEPDAPTEAEWVAAIGRAAGWEGEVVAVPPEELPEQQRTTMNTEQPFFLDTTRIRQELGYHEETIRRDALRETVRWEREHPPG